MWMDSMIPFTVLLSFLFLYTHLTGLFIFGALTAVINQVNGRLRAAITEQKPPRALPIAGYWLTYAIATAAGLRLLAPDLALLRPMALLPAAAPPAGLWDAVFRVTVVDAVVRLAALLPRELLLKYTQVPSFILVLQLDVALLSAKAGHARGTPVVCPLVDCPPLT